MGDLGRSESYYKKKCLETFGHIPPQSEIKKRLGPNLAQAFFESCLPVLKPFIGLCPTLDGPGDDLWVSPSDLLIAKVRLKPPLTTKYIKALTHQGILDIGKEVEDKFNIEHEMEKQKCIIEHEAALRYEIQKDKNTAEENIRAEEKLKHEEAVAELKNGFQETLKEELRKLEDKLVTEKYQAVEEGKHEVEKLMQEKLELATVETVHRLTEQFAGALVKHSQCLHEHFWYHIKKEKTKLKKIITDERSTCKEKLEKLRVEMQCENIANIMYVLAKERRKCCCEKQLLEQNFRTRLEELEKELEERGEKLDKSTKELEKQGHAVVARDEAMYEIIKQFQKFIYFVLQAVPTQAEYLLNIEKLMIVHLTKIVQQTKPKFFQIESSKDDESVTSNKSNAAEEFDGLVAKDYHACDNLVKYVPSTHSVKSGEDLPAFTYGEKLYVREDFRNMISQGLKISQSNEFWNFGVEDVMETIEPEPRRLSDEIEEEIAITDPVSDKKTQICNDKKSNVSVRFSKGFEQVLFEEKVLQSHQYTVVSEVTNIETALIHAKTSRDSLDLSAKKQISKLEMARDSLTILTAKIPRANATATPPHKADSLILAAKRSADSKINGTKEIVQRKHESKIELAVDSILLLKTNPALAAQAEKQTVTVSPGDFVKKRHLVNVGVQAEPDLKSVKISHIEVIPDSDKQKTSAVAFTSRPKIIPEIESETVISCTEQLPLKCNRARSQGRQTLLMLSETKCMGFSSVRKSPDEIYNKKGAFKVTGDKSSTAHKEGQDEFSAKRVNSFIRIFREHPSLRRLFTEVKNK